MSSNDTPASGQPLTPQALDALGRAHARAIARYDAVANLRNVAMTVNAATSAALAQALADPERAGALTEIVEAAERSMVSAMNLWRELEAPGNT